MDHRTTTDTTYRDEARSAPERFETTQSKKQNEALIASSIDHAVEKAAQKDVRRSLAFLGRARLFC